MPVRVTPITRRLIRECGILEMALRSPKQGYIDRALLRALTPYRRALLRECRAKGIDWRAAIAGIRDSKPPMPAAAKARIRRATSLPDIGQ